MSDTEPPDTEPAPVEPVPPTPRNTGGYVLPPARLPAARQQFVDLALAVEGLGAAAATRSAYLDLLATCPADRASPVTCAALAAMSSCALTVRGLWWRAGIRHAILSDPYKIEHAVSDVIQIAHDCGALMGPDHPLAPGDVAIIDGPIHVLTVIAAEGDRITSIDGGQRNHAGLECILRRERALVVGMAGQSLGGRPVLHVVDAIAMAAAEGW